MAVAVAACEKARQETAKAATPGEDPLIKSFTLPPCLGSICLSDGLGGQVQGELDEALARIRTLEEQQRASMTEAMARV